MEVSKDYLSKLLGIIEEQKGVIQAQARIIEEQRLEIIKLKVHIKKQDDIISKLISEVTDLRIKVLEINDLKAENKELKRENKELKAEIKKLKGENSKDSNNSSKPPSSNKFGSRHRNNKKKSNRKVGGQAKHKGNNLNRSETSDADIIHSPDYCINCGIDLSKTDLSGYQEKYRQEIDIVVQKYIKNHHLGYKVCPKCGKVIYGKYPSHIKSNLQYGTTLRSFSSYLSTVQLIPYHRLSKLFDDLFNIPLSSASIYNFNTKVSNNIENTLEDIKSNILRSDLIHADETGLYCNNKRYWGYVFSNKSFTYLDFNKSRSKNALDEFGILNKYTGKLMTDFYAMYRKYPNIDNYFCNAHLMRELTFLHEIDGKYWAKRFFNILLSLKNLDRKAKNYKKEKKHLIYLLKSIIKTNLSIETRLHEENVKKIEEERLKKDLKKRRGKFAQTNAKNLLDRLNENLEGYLGFAHNINIPFTNNLAERDFRFIKIQQNISGTFRTEEGVSNFLRIASVISTLKKQNLNILESLKTILLGKKLILDYG